MPLSRHNNTPNPSTVISILRPTLSPLTFNAWLATGSLLPRLLPHGQSPSEMRHTIAGPIHLPLESTHSFCWKTSPIWSQWGFGRSSHTQQSEPSLTLPSHQQASFPSGSDAPDLS